MKTTVRILSLVMGFSLFFAGCGSEPTAEINSAKAAVASSQTEDVKTYAPESLKAAEDGLNKALAEVQAQDSKFALSRDYKQASALLKSAKDLAEKAKGDAQVGKVKAKSDAEATIAALPQMIDEAKKALARAPRGKDTKADLEAMQNDLKLAEEADNEANAAMAQSKYGEAVAKADTAKSKATAIVDQIKKAQEKARGRR